VTVGVVFGYANLGTDRSSNVLGALWDDAGTATDDPNPSALSRDRSECDGVWASDVEDGSYVSERTQLLASRIRTPNVRWAKT